MCGACGSGTVRAPWETREHGSTPAHLAARAAQAQELVGRQAVVRPFGPAGYTVSTGTGVVTVHRDLDDLLSRLLVLAGTEVAECAARVGRQPGAASFVAGVALTRVSLSPAISVASGSNDNDVMVASRPVPRGWVTSELNRQGG